MADYNDPQYQPKDGELDVPEQPLPQDYATPAAPPEENDDDTALPSDHPELDTNLDEHEVYDEGQTNASGVHDQDEDDQGHGNVQ